MSHDVRLIDANALLDAMPKNDELLSLDVRRVICDAPAIDAVPVVRCGKCKLRHSSEFCECRPEDGFCSDGEPMQADCENEIRPIDANRLLDAIYEEFQKTDPTGEEQLGYLACRQIVRNMPTINCVQTVHAEWLFTGYYNANKVPVFRCSRCKQDVADHYVTKRKYCSHCGAQMDGGISCG